MHSIEREAFKSLHVVRERLTKMQATTRPDHVWPEVWTRMGKAAQNRANKNVQQKSRSLTMLEN